MALRLDFTTLRIFLAVAETRNITRAAEREHIASSAVSKRLSDLEHMLGATLLYRLPRGVDLTPAGEALRHHAQNILNSADRLAADLGDYAVGIKGHVRMMANASSVAEFLPDDISRFCGQYPDINIDLQEANSGPIVKAVAEGQCDIGIFTGVDPEIPGLEIHDYRSDRFVLVAPQGHPFAVRASMPFRETLSEYFVGTETMTAWDALLSRAALEANGVVRYRFRLKNINSICRMVSAGLGVTVMPAGMITAFSSELGLVSVALEDAWAERQLSIATRGSANLPTPARLMVSHLRREALPPQVRT